MSPNRAIRRSTLGGAAATALAVALAACGGPSTGERTADGAKERPSRGGTVVLGLPADLDNLNPYLSRRAANRDIAYHIFASLAEEQADFGQGPPTFRPSLASDWQFSGDGRELTFHLRPEAVWSDGAPITAEDVRFSWQVAIHPDVAWVGADVKSAITDVRIDSPHAVTFVFSRVYPYQLMDANEGVILPRHIWEEVPFTEWRTSGLDRQPVCSGPFRVERWIPNQTLELVRNDRYWDPERPYLDRVVYRVTPDAAAGLGQLLAGELDYWDSINPADSARAEADPDVDIHRYTDRFYAFIMWNCARPLFAEPEVRRALTLAINRQRIVDDLLFGAGWQATGPLPPLYWAHDENLAPHPYDPGAARRLLAGAGWTDSDGDGWLDRDGRIFAFELETTAESSLRRDVALLVQEDLHKLGVDARPTSLERNTFNTRHRSGDFDAFIGGWRLPTKVELAVMFETTARETGVNYGGYSNSRLDDLLAEAAAVKTSEEALPLFREALYLLHDDAPYTFLYWRQRLVGIGSRIRDTRPNALSPLFNLDEWWIPVQLRRS